MFDLINEIETQGILPTRWLREAATDDIIFTERYKIPEANFQPATLDLRLGETAHRLRCSFLPDSSSVMEKLADLGMEEIDLRDGAILERNRPYLIPLIEELRLPEYIQAKTNPRSSTGRLDIFTRVITDHSHKFDEVTAGYHGRLYLEVVSRSFTIKVQTGLSLNQLRLFKGDPRCQPGEVRQLHREQPVVLAHGGQIGQLSEPGDDNSVNLGVDLIGHPSGVGFRAKKNSNLLDLSRRNYYDPGDYWEAVLAEKTNRIVLEPEEFYLLTAAESVRVPPDYAVEMTAFDPSSGELRTHYAGFFDPGFGFGDNGKMAGVQPVMEVRAHDVPFMIEHGQKVCTLTYEKMLEAPDKLYGPKIGSSYQGEGLVLSGHFKPTSSHQQLDLFGGQAQ
jgi:dCTP deaminase